MARTPILLLMAAVLAGAEPCPTCPPPPAGERGDPRSQAWEIGSAMGLWSGGADAGRAERRLVALRIPETPAFETPEGLDEALDGNHRGVFVEHAWPARSGDPAVAILLPGFSDIAGRMPAGARLLCIVEPRTAPELPGAGALPPVWVVASDRSIVAFTTVLGAELADPMRRGPAIARVRAILGDRTASDDRILAIGRGLFVDPAVESLDDLIRDIDAVDAFRRRGGAPPAPEPVTPAGAILARWSADMLAGRPAPNHPGIARKRQAEESRRAAARAAQANRDPAAEADQLVAAVLAGTADPELHLLHVRVLHPTDPALARAAPAGMRPARVLAALGGGPAPALVWIEALDRSTTGREWRSPHPTMAWSAFPPGTEPVVLARLQEPAGHFALTHPWAILAVPATGAAVQAVGSPAWWRGAETAAPRLAAGEVRHLLAALTDPAQQAADRALLADLSALARARGEGGAPALASPWGARIAEAIRQLRARLDPDGHILAPPASASAASF